MKHAPQIMSLVLVWTLVTPKNQRISRPKRRRKLVERVDSSRTKLELPDSARTTRRTLPEEKKLRKVNLILEINARLKKKKRKN